MSCQQSAMNPASAAGATPEILRKPKVPVLPLEFVISGKRRDISSRALVSSRALISAREGSPHELVSICTPVLLSPADNSDTARISQQQDLLNQLCGFTESLSFEDCWSPTLTKVSEELSQCTSKRNRADVCESDEHLVVKCGNHWPYRWISRHMSLVGTSLVYHSLDSVRLESIPPTSWYEDLSLPLLKGDQQGQGNENGVIPEVKIRIGEENFVSEAETTCTSHSLSNDFKSTETPQRSLLQCMANLLSTFLISPFVSLVSRLVSCCPFGSHLKEFPREARCVICPRLPIHAARGIKPLTTDTLCFALKSPIKGRLNCCVVFDWSKDCNTPQDMWLKDPQFLDDELILDAFNRSHHPKFMFSCSSQMVAERWCLRIQAARNVTRALLHFDACAALQQLQAKVERADMTLNRRDNGGNSSDQIAAHRQLYPAVDVFRMDSEESGCEEESPDPNCQGGS